MAGKVIGVGMASTARRLRRVGSVFGMAVVLVALFAQPASADQENDLTAYSQNHCGIGFFQPYGEHFYVYDYCSDGHSAVLRVDVEPIGTSDHYDFRLWNSGGSGTEAHWNKSYAEGKTVCIQAGIGEYGNKTDWNYGRWVCGAA